MRALSTTRRIRGLILSLILVPFPQALRHLDSLALLSDLLYLCALLRTLAIALSRRHLLLRTLLPFSYACEVVNNAEVEGRRLELDLAAHNFSPLVSRSVDPADQIQMVDAFERTQVRSLEGCLNNERASNK